MSKIGIESHDIFGHFEIGGCHILVIFVWHVLAKIGHILTSMSKIGIESHDIFGHFEIGGCHILVTFVCFGCYFDTLKNTKVSILGQNLTQKGVPKNTPRLSDFTILSRCYFDTFWVKIDPILIKIDPKMTQKLDTQVTNCSKIGPVFLYPTFTP